MGSLRSQFRWTATGLAATQLTAVGFGIVTWQSVLDATEREQDLADSRAAVDALRESARETYVHQAHTFIEGGAGHLHHLGEIEEALDADLTLVTEIALPPAGSAAVQDIRAAITASGTHFAEAVVPMARTGTLDREAASAAHATAERLAGVVATTISRLTAVIDEEQRAQRRRIEGATRRAWQVTALATVVGLVVAVLVARWLELRLIDPLGRLRAAADGFGAGRDDVTADESGNEELAAVSRAFNRMTGAVRSAQGARVRAERLAALGELSAAVAHELMNPLTVILGHPAMRADNLAPVRAEAEHARRVVQGLLGFARPGEEAPESIALAAAARAASARVTPEADVRDVAIRVVEEAALVAVLPPGAVRHVLDNLIRNAVQASPPGSLVEVRVRIAAVEVLDRGPGIPVNVRDRLYEPFTTGRPEGTGLGLAVCQRVARGTGGRIEHEARTSGGTIARWWLVAAGGE
jgi:signal transduction histidine kinase